MIGIYCIENVVDGKRYIGQSKNVKRRLLGHFSCLKICKHENRHLQFAWNKYGENVFISYVLEECSLEDMDNREVFYIQKFNTMNDKFGYNLENGGNKNKVMSAETRNRISISRIGKSFMSEEGRRRIGERARKRKTRLGSKMTEDNKRKLLEVHRGNKYTLGYKHTEANKKKFSEQRKGNKYRLGIPHSEETKKKISESLRGKRLGIPRSKETIDKMVAAKKRNRILRKLGLL